MRLYWACSPLDQAFMCILSSRVRDLRLHTSKSNDYKLSLFMGSCHIEVYALAGRTFRRFF